MARKPRPFRESRNPTPKREPYDLVLIVCEGSKTEPTYFRALISELSLSSANVEIVGEECGSSPQTVVQYALEKFDSAGGYDAVFCVFDKDSHPKYPDALNRCLGLRKRYSGKMVEFQAITSDPCFEYWLLLHFDGSTKPFAKTDRQTVGQQCVRELKRHLPEYEKGMNGVYEQIRVNQDVAMRRAQKLRSDEQRGNPHTLVDIVITKLREVKAQAAKNGRSSSTAVE